MSSKKGKNKKTQKTQKTSTNSTQVIKPPEEVFLSVGEQFSIWLKQILNALKQAAIKSNDDNCFALAKEAAYSFILSFFPMLVALITLFFIWGNATRSITEILTTLNRMMPTESYKIVENYIQSMTLDSSSKLFWFR